ncbi:MAG: hypothetical protein WBX25_30245, partial [Rhodomicrobium sp.]
KPFAARKDDGIGPAPPDDIEERRTQTGSPGGERTAQIRSHQTLLAPGIEARRAETRTSSQPL